MNHMVKQTIYAGVLACLMVAIPASAAQAPFVVEGKTYDLQGKLSVKGKARCGKFAGAGGGKSKQELTASIVFLPDDQFSWLNDSLSSPLAVSHGAIMARNKNGKRLTLAFNGEHATALLAMANIPSTPDVSGQDVATTHSIKANVNDKRIVVQEKAVMKFDRQAGGMNCKYTYTIGRKMKGAPSSNIYL